MGRMRLSAPTTLYADDVALRQRARAQGIATFGTADLITAISGPDASQLITDLAVLPRDVGQAGDGWFAAGGGVGSVVIVEVEPGGECFSTGVF